MAAVGLVVATVVLGAVPSPAGADPLCTVTDQITFTTSGYVNVSSMSADGTQIAFTSANDLTGGNPDESNEIFLYDTTTGSMNQITSSEVGSTDPSISADGTRIAFASEDDLTGGNADLNREIFLFDSSVPSTIQVTATTGSNSNEPSLSGDGTRIAYQSSKDLGDNPDENQEIFLFDATVPSTTQLTDTEDGSNGDASVSGDGSRIAFGSTADIVPGLNPDLNSEIFVYDTGGPSISQITATTGSGTDQPWISADGTRTAFASWGDLTGGNPDGNLELFVHDAITSTTTQATSTTVGGSSTVSLSRDGTRVGFTSSSDLTGDNPDGNTEMFMHDTTAATNSQVSFTADVTALTYLALSADGTQLALTADLDLAGGNLDGNHELFLGACGALTPSFSDVDVDATYFDQIEWMVAARIASGFPNGTFKPQDAVKRQQMANFMYNLAGRPEFTPPVDQTFVDYPPSSTYYEQVEWMADEEIASGFPDGTFRPQEPVKRQQMANFLYNLAGQPTFVPPSNANRTFSDYPANSTYYKQVEWMAAEEVASGFPDGTFRPQEPVKRQQMANFMYNFAVGVGVGV